MATNNIRVLPGHTGIISLVLKLSKTSFIPCHTIIGKGIAYVKPFDSSLPLRPVEIEFKNNRCCLEVCNTSDSTIEFQYGWEIAYFDARSKGLVQINNTKHFPIDQYLYDSDPSNSQSQTNSSSIYHHHIGHFFTFSCWKYFFQFDW